MEEKYGVIDIGSNSLRLVIYQGYREVENVKVVARLGQYLDKKSKLSEQGIGVLLEVLLDFQAVTRHHQVEKIICGATATIRKATNQQEICQLVEEKTDFSMKLLTEYEEAYYGYKAVIHSSPFVDGITVDMGGGSTEVTYVKDRKLVHYHSFSFGSLSLKQQFVAKNIPTEKERKEIAKFVRRQFQQLDWLKNSKLPIIAIGGSARRLGRSHQEMVNYPIAGEHLYRMDKSDMHNVQNLLTSLSYEELQRLDGITKERADTIVGAVQAFLELVDIASSKDFYLSRKGLREGLLYHHFFHKLDNIPTAQEVKATSIHRLVREYHVPEVGLQAKYQDGKNIAKQLQELGVIYFFRNDYFYYGLVLYNIGKYIDLEASKQHSFYLLANKTIDGFVHKERIILALLASYQSRSTFKEHMGPFKDWFTVEEREQLQTIGALMKLINGIHVTSRNIVDHIKIVAEEKQLTFYITCNSSYLLEKEQAERQKKHLAKALNKQVDIQFQ